MKSSRRFASLVAVSVVVVAATLTRPAVGQESDDKPAEAADSADAATSGPVDGGELLSTTEAVEIAVENNHDVEIDRRREQIAERNYSLGNAGFLPTVDGTASQRHVFGGTGLFGQDTIRTSTQFGIGLNWTVFEGLRRFRTYDRLEAEYEIGQLSTRAEIEATLQEVTTAYWEVVRQRRLLEARRETRNVSEQRLEIARSRLDAGVGSEVDVNQARVQLNQDRSALAERKIAVSESKTALNRKLGRAPDTAYAIDADLEIERGLEYATLKETALEQNRNLRLEQRRHGVARYEVRETRAEKWPRLDLSLGYNYTEYHTGVAPNFDTVPALEYGLQLTVPIFRAFEIDRRVDNATSRVEIADYRVRRERLRVATELKDAYEAYRRHLERVELAEGAAETARENVEIALTRLEVGTITQVELRQVQLDLLEARTRLVDAKFRAKTAEIRLRRLAGRLYDDWL